MISTLKRTATAILDKGGIIRKIDNHGTRELPYKISVHNLVHRTGSHFIVEFDAPPTQIADLKEEFGRDIDIIRRHIFAKKNATENIDIKTCTLDDEMKPAAYRSEVIEMMKVGQKNFKKKFEYKSGFDYYPFQK